MTVRSTELRACVLHFDITNSHRSLGELSLNKDHLILLSKLLVLYAGRKSRSSHSISISKSETVKGPRDECNESIQGKDSLERKGIDAGLRSRMKVISLTTRVRS